MAQARASVIRKIFARIHRPSPDADTELTGTEVDVIDAGVALDTPTFILIAPWTIKGLAFPPDVAFPTALTLDGTIHIVYSVERSMFGPYRSVNLAPSARTFPARLTRATSLNGPRRYFGERSKTRGP